MTQMGLWITEEKTEEKTLEFLAQLGFPPALKSGSGPELMDREVCYESVIRS
jgi:hypothetical protein